MTEDEFRKGPPKAPMTREVAAETMKMIVAEAFAAGCMAVHENYQPDRDPDFTEAANDYAQSVMDSAS